ncbi:MAG: electron transfer flavoprotein subunit beta/FixA family protein [Deltaproteobacteria bacterium]|nr:electron transfer flavoprotein subunit beta/FixA family protein [Deltaproteobacteria bacterium]
MKIGVLLKQVPDTETKIRIRSDSKGIETDGIKYILNPYDEFAVEEALKVKEKVAGSEVVIFSMGPARVVEAIRTALAMGADRGIHVEDTGLVSDSYIAATVLANTVRQENLNLLLCGKKAIDDDASQVVAMVAEFLNWPQVNIIEKLELNPDGQGAVVHRRVGGGTQEVYDVGFPCVLSCEKGLNSPRYASLPGIMKAKTKPLAVLKATDLVGDNKIKTEFVNWRLPPERKAGKIIQGETVEAKAKELVRLLREEAKVL